MDNTATHQIKAHGPHGEDLGYGDHGMFEKL